MLERFAEARGYSEQRSGCFDWALAALGDEAAEGRRARARTIREKDIPRAPPANLLGPEAAPAKTTDKDRILTDSETQGDWRKLSWKSPWTSWRDQR